MVFTFHQEGSIMLYQPLSLQVAAFRKVKEIVLLTELKIFLAIIYNIWEDYAERIYKIPVVETSSSFHTPHSVSTVIEFMVIVVLRGIFFCYVTLYYIFDYRMFVVFGYILIYLG